MAPTPWLIEQLPQAEHEQRAFVSVRHQMKAAKFPQHRDRAGSDFDRAKQPLERSRHQARECW